MKRICKVMRRVERLLDGTSGYPANEVQIGTGFVIGTRCPCSTERLLADNGTGRLVVEVEISGRVYQTGCRSGKYSAVLREQGASQGKR